VCRGELQGGDVFLRHARADHLDAVIDKLRDAGATVTAQPEGIRIQGAAPAFAHLEAQNFRTTEYPGFPPTCKRSSWRSTALSQGDI
jgi:UDP-N-acetylglucosamine 1-carboxyvinyltransferase